MSAVKQITEKEIREAVRTYSLIGEIDRLRKGHLRIATELRYPDGTSVEVFLLKTDGPPFILSDLGQTTAWLLTVQIRPWLSKKRLSLVEDVLKVNDIAQSGGAFEYRFSKLEDLPRAILRLSQGCLRIADLTFTKRNPLQSVTREELEEALLDMDVPFDVDVELLGRYGKPIRIDFLTKRAGKESSILTLSGVTPASAHSTSNEIFRKWYDLSSPSRHENKITVFDDRKDVYQEEDLSRLKDMSILVPLSDRKSLSEIVAV
jgi:hypothetical protein